MKLLVEVAGARVARGVSIGTFDPAVAAGVVGFLGLHLQSRRRPQLGGLVAALDRVDVRVLIDGYGGIREDLRRAFIGNLPYDPLVTWWVEGEKVTY